MTISAIIFDVGDTLWRLEPFQELETRLATRLSHVTGADAETSARAVADSLQLARDAAASGAGTEPDITRSLVTCARQHGVELSRSEAQLVHDELGYADIERFMPNPDLPRLLTGLKANGMRLAAVSNTWTPAPILEGYFEAIGVRRLFDAMVFSGTIGIRKPHPAIYRRVLGELSIDAHETLFVGDRVREDFEGPCHVGMRAALSHEYRQEPPGEAPVVAALAELPRLLRRFNIASGG